MGLGFTAALTLLAAVREILGAGTIAGISIFGESFQPAQVFIMPAGAFISLGCIIALVQKLKGKNDEKKKIAEREEYIAGLSYKTEATEENANEEGGN
jgi:electron transport complex protein RnfE